MIPSIGTSNQSKHSLQ